METPIYKSSSRFFKKHRYFSSFRDSFVLATAKKWFLSTNQSPRQLYSTTVTDKNQLLAHLDNYGHWLLRYHTHILPAIFLVFLSNRLRMVSSCTLMYRSFLLQLVPDIYHNIHWCYLTLSFQLAFKLLNPHCWLILRVMKTNFRVQYFLSKKYKIFIHNSRSFVLCCTQKMNTSIYFESGTADGNIEAGITNV
jgi:hypothetical protein